MMVVLSSLRRTHAARHVPSFIAVHVPPLNFKYANAPAGRGEGKVIVTKTVCPTFNPEIVNENKPSGKMNPAGGAGETLPTAVEVRLVIPPRSLANETVPVTLLPAAVET
jgi:hypothetical protein